MEHRKKNPDVTPRMIADAVLLADRGVDVHVIAEFVERDPETVRRWLRRWAEQRMAAVFTGHTGNMNASKLDKEQLDEVMEVLARPPEHAGLPAGFWSVPKLASWLETKFEVTYESASSYQFLLRMAGLSFHRPEKVDQRRGPEAEIEARMAEIRCEVADLLDKGYKVLASDEVRIEAEAETRRAWYAKGTKAWLRVDRSKESQSFIGFLDLVTGQATTHRLDWQKTDTVVPVLEQLLADHPDQKVAVVWDNAPWHKSKALRRLLAEGRSLERLHLIALPPYCPDHNPIEHVWKDAKENTANIQHTFFDQTVKAFEDHIASRTFDYPL